MNELTQKWVDALRSGKYKQGKGLLRDFNDNYCCLGVLCEIAGISASLDHCISGSRYTYLGYSSNLPLKIWLNTHESELMGLNDSLKKSFNEIADYIEAE